MYIYNTYAWLYVYVSKICTHVRMYVHVCMHVCMHMCTNNRSSLATGFKNWHFDLPEDGTLIPKHVGNTPLIFIHN
jgi:hypothetical protein